MNWIFWVVVALGTLGVSFYIFEFVKGFLPIASVETAYEHCYYCFDAESIGITSKQREVCQECADEQGIYFVPYLDGTEAHHTVSLDAVHAAKQLIRWVNALELEKVTFTKGGKPFALDVEEFSFEIEAFGLAGFLENEYGLGTGSVSVVFVGEKAEGWKVGEN